ncbi:TetR/AcrR family transcriptional regulator [Rhodovulum sp. DZ06]|uniref:TetR/AcrR family transcriptional regulator n=1 Tax=Rhodovulum sp. DZ06 TaxID=3425126 RepID=UPI003D350783
MARTRAADYDEKREALLQGAARVFATGGYHGASMSALARECGVSKALLYHYWESKEALLFDLIHGHIEGLAEAMEAAPREGDARERLEALVAALIEAYRDSDAEHKVQLNELSNLPEEGRAAVRMQERRLVEMMTEAVAAAAPELPRDKLRPAVMSLFGMLNWAWTWFRDDGPMTRAEYAKMVTALFLDGARTLE